MLALASVSLVGKALTPQPIRLNDIPPVEPGGFSIPVWVVTDGSGEQVPLRWHSVPGALAYTLWRSGDPDGGYRVIHQGSDTTYTDRDCPDPGGQYFYMLMAIDSEFGDSGFSDKKCVEYSGGQEHDGR